MLVKIILSYFIHGLILCNGYGFHNIYTFNPNIEFNVNTSVNENKNNESELKSYISSSYDSNNDNDYTYIKLWDFIKGLHYREYITNFIKSSNIYIYRNNNTNINTKHPSLSPSYTPTSHPTITPTFNSSSSSNSNSNLNSYLFNKCICHGCIWRKQCYTFINEDICNIFRGKYCEH